MMRKGKVGSGGFIWAFLDEAPKRVDLDGHLDTRGNLAPDGIVGPYREKEGSFYTIKEIWAPVVITNKEVPTDGVFTVENRYSFTNLSACHFSYELRKFKTPGDQAAGFDVMSKGSHWRRRMWLPARTGVLKMEMPAGMEGADALAIRIGDPNEKEIFTPVFGLKHLDAYQALTSAPMMANGFNSVSDTMEAVTVMGVNGLKIDVQQGDGVFGVGGEWGEEFFVDEWAARW